MFIYNKIDEIQANSSGSSIGSQGADSNSNDGQGDSGTSSVESQGPDPNNDDAQGEQANEEEKRQEDDVLEVAEVVEEALVNDRQLLVAEQEDLTDSQIDELMESAHKLEEEDLKKRT